ncbi:hypothetical protein J7T55_012047 [Diaporthe amygdali]|uniref:uncharacterized protein n=1 Tax=Phomopsis amygdali TaxID=1214568 RepID=UPI0022FE42C0|nr:uncharacterized protein J7T55_012047 [Diaporthe amygdali]KAJ0123582.1 hypothetical protein J7T55_012047 [Diaporthe amygdali]
MVQCQDDDIFVLDKVHGQQVSMESACRDSHCWYWLIQTNGIGETQCFATATRFDGIEADQNHCPIQRRLDVTRALIVPMYSIHLLVA